MNHHIKPLSFLIPLMLGVIVWYISKNISVGVAVFAGLFLIPLIKVYIPYAKDNPKKVWFKRKLYGWGWTPVTWQGWLVSFLYTALIILFGFTIDENSPPREIFFTFFLPFILQTIVFIRVLYKKGERPKWQWGRKKD